MSSQRNSGVILIFGQISDPHVTAVCGAIERLGRSCCLIDTCGNNSSAFTHEVSQKVKLQLKGDKPCGSRYSAIWWRVKPRFVLPGTSALDLYDYYFVHREWLQVIDFLGTATKPVFSINHRENADRANNKISQLQTAVAVGFEIPETLVSNDPDAIVAFVDAHSNDRCIYKPFTPYMPPTGLITFTTPIDSPIVEANSEAVAAAPGIYQVLVKKTFELRITIVGEDLFSVKINSNQSITTRIDWRQGQFEDIYSRYEVEEEFRKRLLSLHRKLGLFFAAYDFVVDERGRTIFLEVNPTGQWLWLEQKLGLPISERIASALANPEAYGSR